MGSAEGVSSSLNPVAYKRWVVTASQLFIYTHTHTHNIYLYIYNLLPHLKQELAHRFFGPLLLDATIQLWFSNHPLRAGLLF